MIYNEFNNSPTFANLISSCLLFLSITFWLYSRSKLVVDSEIPSSTPQTFNISSEVSSISNRLIKLYLDITTRDNILRKCSLSSNYRYGLLFQINNNTYLLLWILLSGDIATNPGPGNDHILRCLSFNAQSIRSTTKLPDGTLIDNMKSFQDLVYADNLDLILVSETWLNSNFSNIELLSKGYNIIRNDRVADKRGGGVLIALRENITYIID